MTVKLSEVTIIWSVWSDVYGRYIWWII